MERRDWQRPPIGQSIGAGIRADQIDYRKIEPKLVWISSSGTTSGRGVCFAMYPDSNAPPTVMRVAMIHDLFLHPFDTGAVVDDRPGPLDRAAAHDAVLPVLPLPVLLLRRR